MRARSCEENDKVGKERRVGGSRMVDEEADKVQRGKGGLGDSEMQTVGR